MPSKRKQTRKVQAFIKPVVPLFAPLSPAGSREGFALTMLSSSSSDHRSANDHIDFPNVDYNSASSDHSSFRRSSSDEDKSSFTSQSSATSENDVKGNPSEHTINPNKTEETIVHLTKHTTAEKPNMYKSAQRLELSGTQYNDTSSEKDSERFSSKIWETSRPTELCSNCLSAKPDHIMHSNLNTASQFVALCMATFSAVGALYIAHRDHLVQYNESQSGSLDETLIVMPSEITLIVLLGITVLASQFAISHVVYSVSASLRSRMVERRSQRVPRGDLGRARRPVLFPGKSYHPSNTRLYPQSMSASSFRTAWEGSPPEKIEGTRATQVYSNKAASPDDAAGTKLSRSAEQLLQHLPGNEFVEEQDTCTSVERKGTDLLCADTNGSFDQLVGLGKARRKPHNAWQSLRQRFRNLKRGSSLNAGSGDGSFAPGHITASVALMGQLLASSAGGALTKQLNTGIVEDSSGVEVNTVTGDDGAELVEPFGIGMGHDLRPRWWLKPIGVAGEVN